MNVNEVAAGEVSWNCGTWKIQSRNAFANDASLRSCHVAIHRFSISWLDLSANSLKKTGWARRKKQNSRNTTLNPKRVISQRDNIKQNSLSHFNEYMHCKKTDSNSRQSVCFFYRHAVWIFRHTFLNLKKNDSDD